ncbi:hypothetical protein C1645_812205 [Glomus cerebriforme]|uniref:Uncharacterized protein n=1 Tax=Glomus cerebriforme TaxID=658196 RepID=A0A397TPN8_9GLOM|nr:hypothetical protein C1645_812205 [Glomus cerebriforme]
MGRPTFDTVCQTLVANKVTPLLQRILIRFREYTKMFVDNNVELDADRIRALVQIISIYFKKYHQILIEPHNVIRIRALQQIRFNPPWTSNLSIPIHLLNELLSKGNEMELFRFFPANPYRKNLKDARYLKRLRLVPLNSNSSHGIQQHHQRITNYCRFKPRNTIHKKRTILRKYKKRIRYNIAPINNQLTLNQIACIPRQNHIDDPQINQFFNGFKF